jgi:hypothetical protein
VRRSSRDANTVTRRGSKNQAVFEVTHVRRTSLNGGLISDSDNDHNATDDDHDDNDNNNNRRRRSNSNSNKSDMYAEHHGDARHEKTKFTGMYVVHPLRRAPHGYTFSDSHTRTHNDITLLHQDGFSRLYDNESIQVFSLCHPPFIYISDTTHRQ